MGSRGASSGVPKTFKMLPFSKMDTRQLKDVRADIKINLDFNTVTTPSIRKQYERQLQQIEQELKARKKR